MHEQQQKHSDHHIIQYMVNGISAFFMCVCNGQSTLCCICFHLIFTIQQQSESKQVINLVNVLYVIFDIILYIAKFLKQVWSSIYQVAVVREKTVTHPLGVLHAKEQFGK